MKIEELRALCERMRINHGFVDAERQLAAAAPLLLDVADAAKEWVRYCAETRRGNFPQRLSEALAALEAHK